MIEKKIKIGNLYAFYGHLLTNKQQEILTHYCIHDLSLGEISENLQISRQAVYDTIKRSETLLEDYEKKLKLLDRFVNTRDKVNNLLSFIEGLRKDIDTNFDKKCITYKIDHIEKLTLDILDEIS